MTTSSTHGHLVPETRSKTGVRIADDFRDNLIIDRYDPVFAGMRASKRKHLRSENSEDVVTWNVFRSLRHVDPATWVPAMFAKAFPELPVPDARHATVELWQSIAPPRSLTIDLDEGESEVDIVIEAPSWVWFVEAKLRSDISTGTTTRPTRDQLLRNVDVGSWYAGVRDFYCSLLLQSEAHSSAGMERVVEYKNLNSCRDSLCLHRPDGLRNLRGVSHLTWGDMCDVLRVAGETSREDERQYPLRALEWMEQKKIGNGPSA
jgi:hypothetical protein